MFYAPTNTSATASTSQLGGQKQQYQRDASSASSKNPLTGQAVNNGSGGTFKTPTKSTKGQTAKSVGSSRENNPAAYGSKQTSMAGSRMSMAGNQLPFGQTQILKDA